MEDKMFDGIFLINSALNVDKMSIFSNEERLKQTCETLDSIDKYCPNSVKVIFDSSPNPVDEDTMSHFATRENTWFLEMGQHQHVKLYSLNSMRSLAETYSFMGVLSWVKSQNFQSKRIYKLSGRYTLTDNFVVDDPSYKDSFVFANALDSWMPEGAQEHCGVSKLFRLRLWHMDYSLLDVFELELPFIFSDCGKYGIDVEHSYWKHLHKYNVVEVEKIGVKGIIAPSGEVIDE